MAACERRSRTALQSIIPLAVGGFEPGTAKSSSEIGSSKAQETQKFYIIRTGKFSTLAGYKTGVQKANQRTRTADPAPECVS